MTRGPVPTRTICAAALLSLALACGSPGGRSATTPEAAPPGARVVATLSDAGRTIHLRVGERLVIAPGRDGDERWALARYPRRLLRRLPGPLVGPRYTFEATAAGHGDLLLVNLAGWPEGPCRSAGTLRRCLTPSLARDALAGPRPLRPKIAGFEVEVG